MVLVPVWRLEGHHHLLFLFVSSGSSRSKRRRQPCSGRWLTWRARRSVGVLPRGQQHRVIRSDAQGRDMARLVFQELFSKQKCYLDEELDFRKQTLDQAHKVREIWGHSPGGPWGRQGKGVPLSNGVSWDCAGQASDPCLGRALAPCDRVGTHLSLWSPVAWQVPRVPCCRHQTLHPMNAGTHLK